MKRSNALLLLIALLSLAAIPGFAQDSADRVGWPVLIDDDRNQVDPSSEQGRFTVTGTATDPATGDVVVVGNARGITASAPNVMRFGPLPGETDDFEVTFTGTDSDIVVARYNAAGSVRWVRTVDGGVGREEFVTDVAIDSTGAAVIAGIYSGQPTLFGASNLIENIDRGQGSSTSRGYYVAKIDRDGDWQWARRSDHVRFAEFCGDVLAEGILAACVYAETAFADPVFVDVDAEDSVYVGGTFRGALIPDGEGPDNDSAAVVLFGTSIIRFGGLVRQVDGPIAEATYSSGCHIGRTRIDLRTNGACRTNLFVQKYSTSGEGQWLRQGGTDHAQFSFGGQTYFTGNIAVGTLSQIQNQKNNVELTGFAVNPQGTVYVAGTTENRGSAFSPRFDLVLGTNSNAVQSGLSFVASLVEDSGSGLPGWQWLTQMSARPFSDVDQDISNEGPHLDDTPDGVAVGASFEGTPTFFDYTGAASLPISPDTPFDPVAPGDGIYVAEIMDAPPNAIWNLLGRIVQTGPEPVGISSIVADSDGVVVSGTPFQPGSEIIPAPIAPGEPSLIEVAGGGRGVVVYSVDYDGTSRWTRTIPAVGTRVRWPRVEAMSIGATGTTTIAGDFLISVILGSDDPGQQTLTGDLLDSFVTQLSADGTWAKDEFWRVGQTVPPPPGADPSIAPTWTVTGVDFAERASFFYYDENAQALYATRQTATCVDSICTPLLNPTTGNSIVPEVSWSRTRNPADPKIIISGSVDEPLATQKLVAGASISLGSAVDPETGAELTPVSVLHSEVGGILTNFDAFRANDGAVGRTVILLTEGELPIPTATQKQKLAVIESVPIVEPAGGAADCTIGTSIPRSDAHDDAPRNGAVLSLRGKAAPVDAFGVDAAYDPQTRTGEIFPVNEDPFAVAWYELGALGIRWPTTFDVFSCEWPEFADTIVVASLLGNEALYKRSGGDQFGLDDGSPIGVANGSSHFGVPADLDGDGDADLLAGDPSGGISWFENRLGETGGSGPLFDAASAGLEIASAAEVSPDKVLSADLDLDGDQDVLFLEGDSLGWIENLSGEVDGVGGPLPRFGDPADSSRIRTFSGVATGFVDFGVADLDGDGDPDVVAASSNGVVWFVNQAGEATGLGVPLDVLDPARALSISAPPAGADSIDFGDYDGDGDIDVVTASSAAAEIVWHENRFQDDPGSPFTRALVRDSGLPAGPYLIEAADVDGDQQLDVILAASGDDQLWLYPGGPGSIGPGELLSDGPVDAVSLAATDIDLDQDVDIVVGSGTDGVVSWIENLGGGVAARFGDPSAASQRQPIGSSVPGTAGAFVFDLNGDSSPDIGISTDSGSAFRFFANSAGLVIDTLDPVTYGDPRIYYQPLESEFGYNPNDEHALIRPSNLCAQRLAETGSFAEGDTECPDAARPDAVFALRAQRNTSESEPFVLLKYRDGTSGGWQFRVFAVVEQLGGETFDYRGIAGQRIFPPYPLSTLQTCEETNPTFGQQRYFEDHKGLPWARAAGPLSVDYYYPISEAEGFLDDTPENMEDNCVAFVDQASSDSAPNPIDVGYSIVWPENAPVLRVGETLIDAKKGLPNIVNQAAVSVVYDPLLDCGEFDDQGRPQCPGLDSLVQLVDPTSARFVDLANLPGAIETRQVGSLLEFIDPSLPLDLVPRLFYDPLNRRLGFRGVIDDSGLGDPIVLLNVMTDADRAAIKQLEDASFGADEIGTNFTKAVEGLFHLTRNPNGVHVGDPASIGGDAEPMAVDEPNDVLPGDDLLIGFEPEVGEVQVGSSPADVEIAPLKNTARPLSGLGTGRVLTAGSAAGTGYVTVAFNNDASLGDAPISLEVIRVECDPYQGQIHLFAAENIFSESFTLRHSGDFGGDPERYEFEWFVQPDVTGTPPDAPPIDATTGQISTVGTSWRKLDSSEPVPVDQNRFTITGRDVRRALVDNWFFVHYREREALEPNWSPVCATRLVSSVDPDEAGGVDPSSTTGMFSPPAGSPAGNRVMPEAQLAEGWIKRVVLGLNAFEARVTDFHSAPTETFASLLISAGERFEGPIALNSDPNNLNSVGLIGAYATVLRRARELSIDAAQPLLDFSPINNALLLAAGRISDLYMALGNEAFGDAADPTIGFTTASGETGTLAPAIFSFQNQLDSLLDEELVLLRGRDDSLSGVSARPVYNRLVWNFTGGEGELAYAQNYNISDQVVNGTTNGVIDEFDARVLFPQGHGDAWGHYLTAISNYYDLLRNVGFTWEPRGESVSVGGTPIPVDFLDERKFARAAAARARTGAQIVDLTYRKEYTEDPSGQWQGYKDVDPVRAWGLSGWAKRSGKAAYYDWVVANSLLPEEYPNPTTDDIQRIDRGTVGELSDIATAYAEIQVQIDEADRGLNPLGLPKGVVPFDIDPSQVDAGITHFEQIQSRALVALENAVAVYDNANLLTNRLRENQDSVDDFSQTVAERERDFENRLIESFGTPYSDDIGPTGSYPDGYSGPDLFHYMVVDRADDDFTSTQDRILFAFTDVTDEVDLGVLPLDSIVTNKLVEYSIDPETFVTTKSSGWVGRRTSPGSLQIRLTEAFEAQSQLDQAIERYRALLREVLDLRRNIEAQAQLDEERYTLIDINNGTQLAAQAVIDGVNFAAEILKYRADLVTNIFTASAECLPTSTGLSTDVTSLSRCALEFQGLAAAQALNTSGDAVASTVLGLEAAKNASANAFEIALLDLEEGSEVVGPDGQALQAALRREPILRLEAFERADAVEGAVQNYRAELARGIRILDERTAFRAFAAAETQEARYRDVSFRVFRNDALQKYRAAFDLAARYAHLAATAYDYETNLLQDRPGSGERFLTDIVKFRSLGQVINGSPVPGSRGLADVLGRMDANFAVQKGQLGFNNPQTETNRFSLRRGKETIPIAADYPRVRVVGGQPVIDAALDAVELAEHDAEWTSVLASYYRADLNEIPEFRRFARPFASASSGPQPGLVIPFSTTVTPGLDFFGNPLGEGDSAYDSTNFATKVRSAGVWFENYECLPLSNTPRVYLIPTGLDVLRSPTAGNFGTREWQVADVSVPVPFPVGALDLDDPDWVPAADSLSEPQGEIRRFSSFRAFPLGAEFDPLQTTTDSRLIGRSVWNTNWMLIIPGQNLLFDPEIGLDTFVNGSLFPQPGCDPGGVSDIRIFFQTYAISGN